MFDNLKIYEVFELEIQKTLEISLTLVDISSRLFYVDKKGPNSVTIIITLVIISLFAVALYQKNDGTPMVTITNKAQKVNRGSQKGLASAENLSQAITINHFCKIAKISTSVIVLLFIAAHRKVYC